MGVFSEKTVVAFRGLACTGPGELEGIEFRSLFPGHKIEMSLGRESKLLKGGYIGVYMGAYYSGYKRGIVGV